MARSASQSKPKFSYPKLCFVSLCSSPNHSSLNSWRPILAIVLASYFPLTCHIFAIAVASRKASPGFAANNLHDLPLRAAINEMSDFIDSTQEFECAFNHHSIRNFRLIDKNQCPIENLNDMIERGKSAPTGQALWTTTPLPLLLLLLSFQLRSSNETTNKEA